MNKTVTIIIFTIFIVGFSFANDVKPVKPPVIGISGDILKLENGIVKSFTNEYYVNSVSNAGGVPIIIPISENDKALAGQIELLDGLILTGGADINPTLYGESHNKALGMISPRKDKFETKLLKAAIEKKIPVLGICRGMQFINVYFGGTLYQDIPSQTDSKLKHSQSSNYDLATHYVDIEKNTWLYSILGSKTFVNSFHHQSVKDLAPDFIITAKAKDGIIEGIEKKSGSFCAAVQWHPESMEKTDKDTKKLFKAFIEVCSEN